VDEAARSVFGRTVADVNRQEVNPALARLAQWLDGPYRRRAPAGVGFGQYPGGKEYYRHLVRLHTTLDLTPEEIHRTGEEEMAAIQARLGAVREKLGVRGPAADLHRRIEG
jgi:uncharacterized protein (DUF885 family)